MLWWDRCAGVMLALLAAGCANLAAASSGQVGCPESEIEISDDTTHAGSRTWTATCRGKVYYCSATLLTEEGSAALSCAPDAAGETTLQTEPASEGAGSGSTKPDAEPPSGAAGFEFGMAPDQAREACEEADFAFSGQGRHFECTGSPAGVGMEASVKLRFCEDELCVIVLKGQLASDDGAVWKKAFMRLSNALTDRYGDPTHRSIEWPPDCRKDDAVIGCLKEKRANLRLDWLWGRFNGIVLVMGADQKQADAPSLRITYSSERVSKTGSTGGL